MKRKDNTRTINREIETLQTNPQEMQTHHTQTSTSRELIHAKASQLIFSANIKIEIKIISEEIAEDKTRIQEL